MTKGFLKLMVGIVLIIVSFSPSHAQKEKYHSIFLYNFSKYVKWPDDQSSGSFVIGLLGNSPIKKDLEALAQTKKVNGVPIEIKQFSSAAEISNCHILYVAASASNHLGKAISNTGGKPVLIVTDNPGFAKKGATINFVDVGGKIKFELNQSNAESRGLKVAGSLASLAILV